ncbi:MAG: hypothetical protein ACXAC8_13595 [Candidatus Hodarchaeales archaeon]|jgi:hypothetical protein
MYNYIADTLEYILSLSVFMSKQILLTGAFGNIGESTLLALLDKEYDIRCFDIEKLKIFYEKMMDSCGIS